MPGAGKNKEVTAGNITALIRELDSLSAGENGEMGIACSIGCAVEQEGCT